MHLVARHVLHVFLFARLIAQSPERHPHWRVGSTNPKPLKKCGNVSHSSKWRIPKESGFLSRIQSSLCSLECFSLSLSLSRLHVSQITSNRCLGTITSECFQKFPHISKGPRPLEVKSRIKSAWSLGHTIPLRLVTKPFWNTTGFQGSLRALVIELFSK